LLDDILVQMLSGVTRGMILFIVSSGLTLIFGILRFVNMAHGSFYMVAAFCTYTVTSIIGEQNLGLLVAVLIAPLVIAMIGLCMEIYLVRPIRTREHSYQLILTYA
jgi:branched-chain amino acid transport system permease protein